MRIQVTQEHIDKGERMRGRQCPIALALRDAGISDPTVFTSSIDFGERTVVSPDDVEAFVRRFDAGNRVRPFWFDLDVS